MSTTVHEYGFPTAAAPHTNGYIWPAVQKVIRPLAPGRAFELGCGNGFMAGQLKSIGFDVTGIDPSPSGVAQARVAHPGIQFEEASAYDPLAVRFGTFDVLVSTEVIEHCDNPAAFCQTARSLVSPGGVAIITTPYHGYLKNLALSVFDKWDSHLDPGWVGGHIKLFSPRTLTAMLNRAGFDTVEIHRLGRIPQLAMTMMAVCR